MHGHRGRPLPRRADLRDGRRLAGAFPRFTAARLIRTARVQLESRALWEFYHTEGIARDVRNATVATWDEAHMLDCLAWLYDGFPIPEVNGR